MSVTSVGHFQRSGGAVKLIRKSLIVFQIAKDGKNLFVGPATAPHLRPAIIVLLLTPDLKHSVDGASTTDDVALRHDRWTPIQSFFALR